MKKFIIVMLILVILLGGAGVAYAYFMTDLFKSEGELFVKYFSQTTDAITNNIEDDFFESYKAQKEQSPYINEGKILFKTITDESESEDYNITFEGQTDNKNNKTEQNVSINYTQDTKFDFMYRNVQDIYALQSNSVSENFIAVDNNNLQEFAQKLGIQDITNIPNKIEFVSYQFTDEEKNTLKEKYFNIIKENLTEDNFSKVRENNVNAYVLTLTEEQVENILTKILETAKIDQILNNKFQDIKTVIEEMQQTIENLKNNSAENNYSEEQEEQEQKQAETIKITVYNNKKEIKINIGKKELNIAYKNNEQNERTTITVPIYEEENQIGLIETILIKEKNETKLGYELTINLNVTEDSEEVTYSNVAKIIFDGINDSETVTETAKIQTQYAMSGQNFKYELQYQNENKFKQETTIGDLTEENSYILNNYEGQVVIDYIAAVAKRIQEVNQKLLEEAGKGDLPNPLLNTINITPIGLIMKF